MPGTWLPWSYRASLYALGNTAPSADFITDWKTYRNDIWNLNTDGTVATEGTKKYAKPAGYICVERQQLQAAWTAADLTEGTSVTFNSKTMYIWQVIAFAGIFFGVEDSEYEGGGKRPTFVSGGVQGDQARQLKGLARTINTYNDVDNYINGAFRSYPGGTGVRNISDSTTTPIWRYLDFDSGRVIKTGPDNAPTNLSVRFWRRTS
jgi:hypothetical protein